MSRFSVLTVAVVLALTVAPRAQQGEPTLSQGAPSAPAAQKDGRASGDSASGEAKSAAEAADAAKPNEATLKITSPLGRTGLVTRVRIVAQIVVPPGTTLSPVDFFADGTRVGTVQQG